MQPVFMLFNWTCVIVTLLNRYLTSHCAAVLDDGGVVDKFMGDGVMAFFGDPVPQPDHPLRTCRSALRVQQALPDLGPLLKELGIAKLTVRIGIHTGHAVVGNIGSPGRINYTAIGDTVIVAQRLEEAGKDLGGREVQDVIVLISGAVQAAMMGAYALAPLGRHSLRGRSEEIEVFALEGPGPAEVQSAKDG